jgi:hypothetical protein
MLQIDKKIYAIKKIKLRRGVDGTDDAKIFREVNTLSRLNHRYIVRYYSAWIEDDEGNEIEPPSEESSLSRPGFDSTVQFSSMGRSRGRGFPFNHASFSSASASTSSDESGPDIVFGNSNDGTDVFGHSNSGADASESGPDIVFGSTSVDGNVTSSEDERPTSSGEDTLDDDSDLGLASPIAFRTSPASKQTPRPRKTLDLGPTQTLYISMVSGFRILLGLFSALTIVGICRETNTQGAD